MTFDKVIEPGGLRNSIISALQLRANACKIFDGAVVTASDYHATMAAIKARYLEPT